jgi:hypothetical protein
MPSPQGPHVNADPDICELARALVAEEGHILRRAIHQRGTVKEHQGLSTTLDTGHAVIRELENRRYEAVLKQDYDRFEGLCHAKLVYGHTGGNRDSLATYLGKLRSGTLRYHHIERVIADIVRVGDVALVTGQMTAEIYVSGANKTLKNSYLAVWIADKESWKFLAYQPTPLIPSAAASSTPAQERPETDNKS